MTEDHTDLLRSLERQAHQFVSRPGNEEGPQGRGYLVFDAEYRYDTQCHEAYGIADGESAEQKTRWPFHHLAALAWCVIRFEPGASLPTVDETRVLTLETASEVEMASALFAAFSSDPALVGVTWGGEHKDLAVLRRIAATEGLLLPAQLQDLSPLSRLRIDLCNEVSVRAESVHLPEYAWACSIPSKATQSKGIGKLVEQEKWSAVSEQALGDVATTAIILLRHLASHGYVPGGAGDGIVAVIDAMLLSQPGSAFLRHTVRPWAQRHKSRTALKGVVYRAA